MVNEKLFFYVRSAKMLAPVFLLILLISSCYSSKNVAYFQDLSDTSKVYSQVMKESYEVHIQPDDIIEIIVSSINPEATAPFNQGNTTPVVPGSAPSNINALITTDNRNAGAAGYLVDKGGMIDFPVLGKLKVEGLTISNLKDTLTLMLDTYLKSPIVNARLLNYKITVLGEVTRPSSYTLQSERVSVVDAIGLAGDLTIYGQRDNILLIREENGERKFIRMNLKSSAIFQSPYYFLKQNDVIYVEPNKAKVVSSDAITIRYLAIITTLSTLALVITNIVK